MSMIVGLYDDLSNAEDAIRALEDSGFSKNDVHFATYDERAQERQSGGFFDSLSRLFGSDPRHIGKGQAMLDQLTQWGVPEDDAQRYAEAMRRGSTMVLVNTPDDRAQVAKQQMDRFGPIDIDMRGQQWQQQGWQGYDPNAQPFDAQQAAQERSRYGTANLDQGGETRIPTVEEEFRAGKREVNRGGVRIHRTVTEQPVEQTVNLRDESVNVERRPADRNLSEGDLENAFQEQTFEVEEVDEELITDKQARVTGEVLVTKQVDEHPETARDTVRRTDVEVEDLATGGGRRYRDYSSFENEFRNNYSRNASRGSGNRDYSYYEPAYRYGYDLSSDNRYQGQDWSQIEPQVRQDWERTHPQSRWEEFRDPIRYAWERGATSNNHIGQ